MIPGVGIASGLVAMTAAATAYGFDRWTEYNLKQVLEEVNTAADSIHKAYCKDMLQLCAHPNPKIVLPNACEKPHLYEDLKAECAIYRVQ